MQPASRVPLRYSILDLHGLLNTNDVSTIKLLSFPPTRALAWTTYYNVLAEACESQPVQYVKNNPHLNERLHHFHQFYDDATRTYSAARIPATATLLPIMHPFGGRPRVSLLCQNLLHENRDPITIWVCARVVYNKLEVDEGGKPKKWNVCVDPLDKVVHKHALALQVAFSAPLECIIPNDLPPMICYSPRTVSEDGVAHLMTHCWDASAGLASPRNDMPAVKPADLNVGDLVLAELWLARHMQPDEPQRERCYFHTRSFCILARADSYELNV